MGDEGEVERGGKGLYARRGVRVRVGALHAVLVHRGPTPPRGGIALSGSEVIGHALKESYGVHDTVPELVDALGLVAIVAHRPTQGLYPVLHDLGRPLYAVELGAVAEHGDDVCRVFLLVSDELEGDAPEHGDADEDEARGRVDSVHLDIVGLLGVVVDGVVDVTLVAVGGSAWAPRGDGGENRLSCKGECDVGVSVHPVCAGGRSGRRSEVDR